MDMLQRLFGQHLPVLLQMQLFVGPPDLSRLASLQMYMCEHTIKLVFSIEKLSLKI